MEPLLPSLNNLPVFYTVLISLLLMVGLSGLALYRRLRQRPPGAGFTWLKLIMLLPLWALLLIWTGLTVSMGVFAGGLTGSWLLPLLGLLVIPVFILLSWWFYFWVRGRMLADVAMLLLVPVLVFTVYSVQRLWLCEPLALSGQGHAQLCTARLYEHGDGGAIRNQHSARGWYRQAAEQGVAEAEYQVAGFTHEREQKIVWYSRAADHGHAGAAYQLYWLLEKSDPAAALHHLRAAVQQGHSGAQYRLGKMYRDGYGGVDRDLSRTRELWPRAASAGYISAMRALAIAYARDGILFDYDPKASSDWQQQAYTLAASKTELPVIEQFLAMNWEAELEKVRARHARAEAGEADAQLQLGREILQQAGTDPALIDKAMGWIEQAAETGSVEAQYQLAMHYLELQQEQEDKQQQGRRWLLAAADNGHEQALRKVISASKTQAYGMPRDLQRSRDYSQALFALLKERGVLENDPDWMSAGWEYSDTLKQIDKEASAWLPPAELRQQSDAGDPVARYHQAMELSSTRYDESMALLTASATAGYPQAQYEMARRYRTRKRTLEEEQQAVDWLTAAAERDHRGAKVDLGIVYLQGIKRIGLARNPYRAKVLFEQALQDVEDTVYAQQTRNGRGWKYTVDSVNRWLSKIPEAVMRLELEGLHGVQRQQAIEAWYAREFEALQSQTPLPEGETLLLQKQADVIEQQRAVLLKNL